LETGYVALQRSAVFARLRSRSRRYLAAMTILSLGVFALVVVLVTLVSEPLGTLLAAGLILLPALLSAVHLRYARRRLDPLAERIREDFESGRD
jgi:uncharacterized membrane protein (DUF485 family)